MSAELLLVAVISFLFGSVLVFLICRPKLNFLASKIDQLNSKIDNSKKGELSVITYPYKEEYGEDKFLGDERRAEVGYKFQLFIDGIPCFEPHKVQIEKLEKKQVNVERITQAMNQVVTIIEALASKHPAIAALKIAPNVNSKLKA